MSDLLGHTATAHAFQGHVMVMIITGAVAAAAAAAGPCSCCTTWYASAQTLKWHAPQVRHHLLSSQRLQPSHLAPLRVCRSLRSCIQSLQGRRSADVCRFCLSGMCCAHMASCLQQSKSSNSGSMSYKPLVNCCFTQNL